MDEGTFKVLGQIEGGRHVFRPLGDTQEHREAFEREVERLLHLRAIGLIRLEESRIKKSPDGTYESAGPCDLTPAGIAALSNSRR